MLNLQQQYAILMCTDNHTTINTNSFNNKYNLSSPQGINRFLINLKLCLLLSLFRNLNNNSKLVYTDWICQLTT